MKTRMNKILTGLVLLLTMANVNCGSSGSSGSPAAVTPAAYGTSCGANMLTSQYGCQPQCQTQYGTIGVYYGGQCQAIQQNGLNNTTAYGSSQYGSSTSSYVGNQAVCSYGCTQYGAGYTMMPNGQCAPQGSCGPCYGTDGVNCYIGAYAHQFYGY